MLRFIECRDCLEQGACKECGCTLPDKMFVFDETDSLGKWGPMMNKTDWEDHKQQHGIKFTVEWNSK